MNDVSETPVVPKVDNSRTLRIIAADIERALPPAYVSTMVPCPKSNTFLLRHRSRIRGVDFVLHNITPGMLLLNRDRMINAIVNFIDRLNASTDPADVKVSMFDEIIGDPLVAALRVSYPRLENKTIENSVRSNLYKYSITHSTKFPVREMAYRIHSTNPYTLLTEGPTMETLSKLCRNESSVSEILPKYMLYTDLLSSSETVILLGNMPLELDPAEPADFRKSILCEVAKLAIKTLGTNESIDLCARLQSSRVAELRGYAEVATDLEVALCNAMPA